MLHIFPLWITQKVPPSILFLFPFLVKCGDAGSFQRTILPVRDRGNSSDAGIEKVVLLVAGAQVAGSCALLVPLVQEVAEVPYLPWYHLLTAPGHIISVN